MAGIKIYLDTNNAEDAKLFKSIAHFFAPQSGGTIAPRAAADDPQITKATDIKAAQPVAEVAKVTPPTTPKAVMPTPPATPKAVMPATPATPKAETSGITIRELREMMSTKVTAHIDKIRPKLAELGTANISAMKPEHYQEFYDFLNSL